MSNIVIFGATQSGKTTLLGYLATAMLRHPQFNEEVLQKFKLIKNLTTTDEFSIGNPYNPINVNKDVILPSFVSLDKNELRKFRSKESSEGTTKRLHRKQLTICMSERNELGIEQNENENISCTFVDLPGFRQRLSDKYRGFFEGEVGVAILKLQELIEFSELLETYNDIIDIDNFEKRLFEPIRIWCDYRSASSLVIVISQIDRNFDNQLSKEEALHKQKNDIIKAIECIRKYTNSFSKGIHIPISPISIKIISEKNTNEHSRMSMFFRRVEENIYASPKGKDIPGDGTFISCLKQVMPEYSEKNDHIFSMASVYRPMKAIVNGSPKTALNIHAIHGTVHITDNLMMGPIIDKRDNGIVFTQCDISSIKADGAKSTSDMLLEGNAGGIILKSIKAPGSSFQYNISYNSKESDVSILKSTLIFAGDFIQGNIIELEINKDDHITADENTDEVYERILPSIMPFDEVVVFWYGKKIVMNVVEINFLEDKFKLSVVVSKNAINSVRCLVLPCDEEKKIIHNDNALLAIPRAYYSTIPKKDVQGKYTYTSTNIVGIKKSSDFKFLNVESNLNIDFESIYLGINQIKKNNKAMQSFSSIVPLKRNRENLDFYAILSLLGREIKNNFNRLTYRQSGGCRMLLLKDNNSL